MNNESKRDKLLAALTTKTQAVYDHEFFVHLQKIPISLWMEKPNPLDCSSEYKKRFNELLLNNKSNTISALDRFERQDLINGTTQSFDECYLRYSNKRLRIYRGEYAYHKRIISNYKFIEDGPLESGDYIIVSYPFCSTGNKPENFEEVLKKCESLDIPVEIDCAYFGTCYELNFDFSSSSIKAVSFSLSKSMGLGDIRSGVRYSNYHDDMPIAQQNDYNHLPLMAAKIGLYMMERFDFDYIPNRYKEIQKSLCEDLNLTKTACVHLALGDEVDYSHYLIDNKYYRIGLRFALKERIKGRL